MRRDIAIAVAALFGAAAGTTTACGLLIGDHDRALEDDGGSDATPSPAGDAATVDADDDALGGHDAGGGPAPTTLLPNLTNPTAIAQDSLAVYVATTGTHAKHFDDAAVIGVDTDETDPDDILGQEAIKFLRTMLAEQPNLRPVSTNPFAMLEDIDVNGQKIPNVTYAQMFPWIVDRTGYPAAVGSDPSAILALR